MEDYDLLKYMSVLVKRRSMVLRITSWAFAAAVAMSLALPKSYTATARILPPVPDTATAGRLLLGTNPDLQNLAGTGSPLGIQPDVYSGMLRSATVEAAIVRRFDLKDVYRKKYLSDALKALDKKLSVAVEKKSGIITLSVRDEDPQRAADMANAFLYELDKLTVDMKASTATKERAFLERRLTEARLDLAAAEDRLRKFQSDNNALYVEDQAKASIHGIAELKSQLALHEVQLAALRSYQTEASPEVVKEKACVAKFRSELAGMEGKDGAGAIPSFGTTPTLSQRYVRLVRERDIQSTLVGFLTSLYENAYLKETRDVPDVRILDRASVPDKKSGPKRARIVALSSLSAFMCSVMAALMMEHFERMPAERKEGWRLVWDGVKALRPRLRKER